MAFICLTFLLDSFSALQWLVVAVAVVHIVVIVIVVNVVVVVVVVGVVIVNVVVKKAEKRLKKRQQVQRPIKR